MKTAHDEATKTVMTAIAIGDLPLPYTNANNEQPLVVVFPRDSISDVMTRVTRAGGTSNVAVLYAKKFRMIEMGNLPGLGTTEVIDINPGLSMGMFLLKIEKHPTTTFRIRAENELNDSEIRAGAGLAFAL